MSSEVLNGTSVDEVVTTHENPFLAVFRPYIPAGVRLRELTLLPLLVGTLLGMVFGASSLYLVLKTGLTVSASIPVAVISITLFRALSKFGMKNATILKIILSRPQARLANQSPSASVLRCPQFSSLDSISSSRV